MVACPAFALWFALGPFAAGTPQEDPAAAPRAQAREILAHGDYQQEPPAGLAGDDALQDESDEARNSHPPDEPKLHGGFSFGLGWAPILVPIVVGVLLVLLLLLGLTRKGGLAAQQRAAQQARVAEAMAAAGAAGFTDRFGDPEQLAAEGRFAEAIHELLLRALRGLARSIGGLTRGLTSREILPRAPVGAPRAALQELVAAVELHEFGAHELTARDFERCRAAAAALPSDTAAASAQVGP